MDSETDIGEMVAMLARGTKLVVAGTIATLGLCLITPIAVALWCRWAAWREIDGLKDLAAHPILTAFAATLPLLVLAALDGLLVLALARDAPRRRALAWLRIFIAVLAIVGDALLGVFALLVGFVSAGNGFMIDRTVDEGSTSDVAIKVFFGIAMPWVTLALAHTAAEILVILGASKSRAK